MIKRLFWLIVGGAATVLGINLLKKRAEQNPEQFSTDALVEKFIDVFDRVKIFVARYWQGYFGGEKLNDVELGKIFAGKTILEARPDSTSEPTK
jgi:hypothetical protein